MAVDLLARVYFSAIVLAPQGGGPPPRDHQAFGRWSADAKLGIQDNNTTPRELEHSAGGWRLVLHNLKALPEGARE